MTQPAVRWVPAARSESVASARLRCYRPARALAQAGWDSRLMARHGVTRADVVVFQKAYGDRQLAAAARLRRTGAAVVFDLCDNHFHNPNGDPTLAERASRLGRMVRLADLVTVSTPSLATLVDHPNVVVIDDAVEAVQPATDVSLARQMPRLVWFGNAGSPAEAYGMRELGRIVGELRAVAERRLFELVVVSNSEAAFAEHAADRDVPARYVAWSTASVSRELWAADIALLPVTANPFTVCKTGNRVVTALLHETAVVAGRIPSYEEYAPFIRFEDWAANVEAYLADPMQRAASVSAARTYIAGRFPPGHLADQWDGALRHAIDLRTLGSVA